MSAIKTFLCASLCLLIPSCVSQRPVELFQGISDSSNLREADPGDPFYTNPIMYADYSDPDVIRVGNDFYLTSSSFNCVPGLPILHSNDLVNWAIIGHALRNLTPVDLFKQPQHGRGVWAPSIRYHDGEYYIYYGDPDFGIYVVKAKNPAGPWGEPHLVKEAKGWIDPCPFWDDDGSVFLIHAWAKSRAGFNSILTLRRMSGDGTTIVGDSAVVFDGHGDQPTIEGPKMYKRNGYYYIFAPAGGVKSGWQTVLRSKNIYGPYEDKIVMDQGTTSVNGPHQGAYVELASGESWFVHFQDREAYGRITHLQPVRWIDDWPVIGQDHDGDGKGEPVERYRKPDVGRFYPDRRPQSSDDFESGTLGLQWQWHGNPQRHWATLEEKKGSLRLYAVPHSEGMKNFWDLPNLLLQKFPAPEFSATIKVSCHLRSGGERAGLVIMGTDYATLSLHTHSGKLFVSQTVCLGASAGRSELDLGMEPINDGPVYLRVEVARGAVCRFSFSSDGESFTALGDLFHPQPGRWIGAKVGLFCVADEESAENGFTDFEWFRIEIGVDPTSKTRK